MLEMDSISLPTNELNQKMKFNTQRHYKIWFSKNPDQFLTTQNIIRLIKARLLMPKTDLSFVYSSKCLNVRALEELTSFCQKHNIQAIDFDNDIPKLLIDKYDKYLYKIAAAEIKYALLNSGGNLAAASDCVRLMHAVIEKCGIYIEFDTSVDLSALPVVLEADSDVLLPFVIKSKNGSIEDFMMNNDFLAFAFDDADQTKIHPRALACLQNMQLEVITRYQSPLKAMAAPILRGLNTPVVLDKGLTGILHHLEKEVTNKISIFKLRIMIENLSIKDIALAAYKALISNTKDIDTLSDEVLLKNLGAALIRQNPGLNVDEYSPQQMKNIAKSAVATLKDAFYRQSVMCLSGPFITTAFLAYHLGDFDLRNALLQNDQENINRFIRCVNSASLKNYGIIQLNGSGTSTANQSDVSWTADGSRRAQEQSDTYLNHIILIQRTIREKLQRKQRSINAVPSCKKSYQPIRL